MMDDDFEINLIKNHLISDNCRNFMKKNCECSMKRSEDSVHKRKEGDDIYYRCNRDQRLEEVFKLYSKSIAFAPCNSEDLALAYGSRSAVLFRMNKYEDSLRDIDRALICEMNDVTSKVKLLCRKVECLAALGSPDSKKVFDEVTSLVLNLLSEGYDTNLMQENVEHAKRALNMLKKSSSSKGTEDIPEHLAVLNKKEFCAENIFNSVTVKYNRDFGKQLIVNQDVKPGEIIYVENPYVNCLNLNNYHIYCSHCFIKTWSSIPCDSCNWCMYCSEECKISAWTNYHDIECITVSHLRNGHGINYYDHLSLRCLLMGIKESGGINKFKAEIQSLNKLIEKCEQNKDLSGFFEKQMFQKSKFKTLYATCSEVSTDFLRKHAINCALILIILSKYTSLFGQKLDFEDTKELLKNENVLFVGSVLLKLKKISNRSIHVIQSEQAICKFHTDWITCKMNNCCSKGACIPVVTSFINHSCNPNVKKCMTGDRKLIVYALQPITKNSQLFLTYQQPFYEIERPIRYSLIRQSLNYICNCEACQENWPTLFQMYKIPREKPLLYAMAYKKIESELFDENNTLVEPIICNVETTQFSQATIIQIQKAMEKALENLKQPSIVICELIICLSKVFERLYGSDSSR